MREIKFKTVLSSLQKGGKACYRAIPVTNGSVDITVLSERAAERAGMDPMVMKFATELLLAQIAEEMTAGRRIELENFISGGIAVSGVFEAANSEWDKNLHKLVPFFASKGDLRNAFTDVTGVNVTEGNHCTIKRVQDNLLMTDGVIANVNNVSVMIAGVNMQIDTSATDEGVWLEDLDGTIVANATISASTSTTIDCTFPSFPLTTCGSYKLVVASRGGLGHDYGVSIARKAVEIVPENTTEG